MFFCLPLWGFCSVWAVAFVLVVVVGVCVLAVCDFCPPCGVRLLPLIVVFVFSRFGVSACSGVFLLPLVVVVGVAPSSCCVSLPF